ncbi:type IX secretion system sortase PorU [Hymenobacter jejuensis]|uniref:Type IX secretion system sortase PorU n=1 Tax=Hymenobacter jejuensis TaxID=2502781 RepID=A0A5B7ZWV7_9BACT|nr:type IX secretion system sortase PorU [Hymenobacter jejuensis]QDA59631.1 type IX secretion system sortase PorU [Hymenobacter jejuensis]
MRFFYLLLLLCAPVLGALQSAQAQSVAHGEITWQGYSEIVGSNGESLRVPSFSGAGFQPGQLVGLYSLRLEGAVLQGQLQNTVYQAFTSEDGKLLAASTLPADLGLRLTTVTEMKLPVSYLTLLPVRRNAQSGQLEKLVSFDYVYSTATSSNTARRDVQRNYTNNSVLSQGTWYKIGVPESGIYKLDKNALRSLGLDVNTLDPRRLRIYGNAVGMLPQANSARRPDDLAENDIFVSGNNNATFDDDEYVLFYARGPHTWEREPNATRFRHIQNIYTDTAYYFVTVGSTASTHRVGTAPASSGAATGRITTFTDRQFYEHDLVNLLKSGRQWLGENLSPKQNPSASKEVAFAMPDVAAGTPVQVTSSVAASAVNSTSFRLFLNGSQLIGSQIVAQKSGGQYPERANTSITTFSAPVASSGTDLRVKVTFDGASDAEGWLDYLEVNALRPLRLSGSQVEFRSFENVRANTVSQFVLDNATGATVWEVTNPRRPVAYALTGGSFNAVTDSVREFVAFTPGSITKIPRGFGRVANQNLHAINTDGKLDLVIVTYPPFQAEAERLAAHRRTHDKLNAQVVTTTQVYNEFSSGSQDVTAIRDLMKMVYDRAPAGKRNFLLLFGDASFDYKSDPTNDATKFPDWWRTERVPFPSSPEPDKINQNFVPVYESRESFKIVFSSQITYSSDDYYGLLDNDEGEWAEGDFVKAEALDIGVGRLPVNTPSGQPRSTTQATLVVDKMIGYDSPNAYGKWRNRLTFIADDGDNNLHVSSSTEQFTEPLAISQPAYNIHKVYLDLYPQVSSSAGQRSPDCNRAIDEAIEQGSLMTIYNGHGGPIAWADEQIFSKASIERLQNQQKLTFLFTATCDFSVYDSPELTSAGESALTLTQGGAVALLTTTRLVVSNNNELLSRRFYDAAFTPINGKMPRLGDVVAIAKNGSIVGVGNRNFSLLGDPTTRLAYPEQTAAVLTLNGKPLAATQNDTLKALSRIKLTGEIRNGATTNAGFSGVTQLTVYEKPSTVTTLGNEPSTLPNNGRIPIQVQENIIYDGQATVRNGRFQVEFVVPKDLNYSVGLGKISLYASDPTSRMDAHGASAVPVGSASTSTLRDTIPPVIRLFMNDDESFVFGGLTSTSTTMLGILADSSGINTAGSGIGHEITATLDNDASKLIVLNDFYTADVDKFQRGRVRYLFKDLTTGPHLLRLKAWDTFNNSAEKEIEFIAARTEKLALQHVLNYPNPFSRNTTFHFDHNRDGEELDVQVQIFTVSGKLVRTLSTTVMSSTSHLAALSWDGRDEFSDQLARGVYVYRVSVRSPRDGSTASKYEKLVILN